jgi:hypothetical protein
MAKSLRYIPVTFLAAALAFSAAACSSPVKETKPLSWAPFAEWIEEIKDQYTPVVRTKEEIAKAQKYVYPKKFDVSQASSDVAYILTHQKQDLCDIANYFLIHPELRNGFSKYDSSALELDENYEFSNPDNLNLGSIEPTIRRFLDKCPYAVRILVDSYGIDFRVNETSSREADAILSFSYFNDLLRKDQGSTALRRVAPHWIYSPNWPGT